MFKEFEERQNREGLERIEKLFEEKHGFHPSQPPIQMPPSSHTVLPTSVTSVKDPYPFKEAKDMTPCLIASNCDGSEELIVAEGNLMKSSSGVLVHHEKLHPYHAKVNVDIVLNGCDDTPLPVPTTECQTLQQAIGCFIQWPSELIYINDKMTRSASLKGKKKMSCFSNPTEEAFVRTSLVDELSLKSLGPKCKRLHEHIMEMPPDINGLKVICDNHLFGYEEDFELTITFKDLSKMMNGALLDISIIHAFIVCLKLKMIEAGINSIVFLCPQKCCLDEVHKSPKKFKDYLFSTLTKAEDKNLFMIPYVQRNHWILLVISLLEYKLLIFDPAGKGRTKVEIKNDIEVSFQKFRHETKCPNKNTFQLRYVNCPTQLRSPDCGYYVMRYMHDIVSMHHERTKLLQAFNTSLAYEDKEIQTVLEELVEYLGDHAAFG